MSRPVMIMAGGTGGHIFPALAVAERIRARRIPVVWLGSRGGMEERLVPAQGIPIDTLSVRGLRGKGAAALALAPFKLAWALGQALVSLARHRPRAVLGMGGFAAGPGGVAAWLLRRPLFVHEQNAIPGYTNRILARLARVVMEGFPGSFPGGRAVFTGNPLREAIRALPPAAGRLAGRQGPLRLFVLGGSLGALRLNTVLPQALARFPAAERPEVWHQCGARHLAATERAYAEAGVAARIEPFVEDMAAAYGWADLVVCRAGALTVAELIQVGLPAILVPYPHAVDDHQTANARQLVDVGAAQLVPDARLTADDLHRRLAALQADRARLLAMARAGAALRRPEAAETVARLCLGELRPEEVKA